MIVDLDSISWAAGGYARLYGHSNANAIINSLNSSLLTSSNLYFQDFQRQIIYEINNFEDIFIYKIYRHNYVSKGNSGKIHLKQAVAKAYLLQLAGMKVRAAEE